MREIDEDDRIETLRERRARQLGCGGRGYIPVRGEAMAADPCDCPACNPQYDEDNE